MEDSADSQNLNKSRSSLVTNVSETDLESKQILISANVQSESPNADQNASEDRKHVEQNQELEETVHTESLHEGQDETDLEEFEETYEEEVEEDGELKVIMKTRVTRRKKVDLINEEENAEQEEIEEEYEEEEIDENGEIKVVVKKRLIKVIPKLSNKKSDEKSFVEIEEEFEEEEVDEAGERKLVKKKRIVTVPQKKSSIERVSKMASRDSFEEIEEEYEEEVEDEDGHSKMIKMKRTVKVLKPKNKLSRGSIVNSEIKEEGEEKKYAIEENVKGVELKEEDIEEGEMEEEEEMGLEEEEEDVGFDGVSVGGEKITQKEKKPGRRKKKSKKDKLLSEEDDIEYEITKKRRKRRKRKSKDESNKSVTSIDTLQEGEDIEEEGSLGGIDEEVEEEEVEEISLSSSQRRAAEERAAIAEQFEILQRLRSEHVSLKKKNFHLTNKLIQYFKKQKMDHVFTESKEDPDLDQRYLKKLTQFYESNKEINDEKQYINTDWEAQLAINEDLDLKVKEGWEQLLAHKREVSAKLIDSRTGRTIINDKTVEDLVSRQESQVKQLCDCRLLQIKLRRRIEDKKSERQMDHMGMDFNLMDYEKLASLKEYYTDKITERDVEVGEINEKMAAMTDKLGHVKEQLKKREEEMKTEQKKLQRISVELEKKRIDLNVVKATKHQTEKKTIKIKQQSGLLAYPSLLKDYEEKTHQLRILTAETEALRQTYKQGMKKIEKLRDLIKRKTVQKYTSIGSSTSTSHVTGI